MKQSYVMTAAMNSQMMKVTYRHHSVLITLKQMTAFLWNLKKYVGRVLEVTEKEIRSTFMWKKYCDKFGNVQFYFPENPGISFTH